MNFNFKELIDKGKLKFKSFGSDMNFNVKSSLMTKVKQICTLLDQEAEEYAVVVDALLPDANLVASELVNIAPNGLDDIRAICEVEQDTYNMVIESLQDIATASQIVDSDGRFSLTSRDGQIFRFKILQDNIANAVYDEYGELVWDTMFTIEQVEDQTKYYYKDTVQSLSGEFMTMTQLMADIKTSSTVDNCLSRLADEAIRLDTSSINDTLNELKDYEPEYVSNLKSTLATSGPIGMLSSLVTSLTNVIRANDDDDTLEFTTNASYVPTIYLAGVVKGLITLASTLITVALGAANIVLLAVSALIRAGVSFVQSYADELADDSKAKYISSDTGYLLPCSPYVLDSGEFRANDVSSWFMPAFQAVARGVINGTIVFGYSEVPGGLILYGPGDPVQWGYQSDERMIRWEFHPSFCSSAVHMYKIWNVLNQQIYITGAWSNNIYTPTDAVLYIPDPDDNPLLAQLFDSAIDEYSELVEPIIPDKYGFLEDESTMQLVTIGVLASTYIYYTWRAINGITSAGAGAYHFGWSSVGLEISGTDLLGAKQYSVTARFLEASYDTYVKYWYQVLEDLHFSASDPLNNFDRRQVLLYLHFGLATWLNHYYANNYKIRLQYYEGISPTPITDLAVINHAGTSASFLWDWSEAGCLDDIAYTWKKNYGNTINHIKWIDGGCMVPINIGSDYNYCWLPPKYDARKSIFFASLAAIAVGAVAAVTVVSTIKFKQWKRRKACIAGARTNKAYQDLCDNPTLDNYNKYQQAAKSQNRWSYITGGPKVSRTDYWFGDTGGGDIAGGYHSAPDTGILYGPKIMKLISGN